MHHFISILFALIIFSVEASEKRAAPVKSDTAVPHNNGTQGLLKDTYIEPIDNFNSIGSEYKKPKDTTQKKQQATLQKSEVSNNMNSTPSTTTSDATPQAKMPVESGTINKNQPASIPAL